MNPASPEQGPDRAGPYRMFEQCNGVVDAEWVLHAQGCTGAELDALTEAQRYVVAGTESIGGIERVRLGRVDGVFSAEELARMQGFLTAAISDAFVAAMVASAQRTGKVTVDDPLGPGQAGSDCSIVGGSVIFLRFTGGVEPFYLLQHNFAVEALYFPMRGCLVHLNDCLVPKVKLRRLFLYVHRSAEQCARYLRSPRRWAGLFFGNESPFHYFYFQLPGVALACFDLHAPLPGTHTLAREYYADIPTMFRLGPPPVVHEDGPALQGALCDGQSFVFSVGVRPRIWSSALRFRMIDDVILQACRRAREDEVDQLRQQHDFVLWAGISSGKRAWREEEDAVVSLARELAGRFGRVALLVDGWTSTMTRNDRPPMYGEDEQAFRRIAAAVPPAVTCFDLVGRDPAVKIALASTVDFFVCSHGTASMYVARIARRRGVSHISNAARDAAIDQHVHDYTTLVPAAMVQDLDPTTADKFRVGYSIDAGEFVRLALYVLDSGSLDPEPEPRPGAFDG
jgi:hypothetical protein